ncbi:Co2+/Mg2+ efflux protein ApaG [Candidatus Berkiella aquae]|uniref:Co2+/Mg2+ efflux protein ApaG n=1 Tax=Candidatus Berkiella aquae TaxID=295108 RepID=UPI00094655C0|nr:Co2+/Mg2+ efflux protein ApaG [Candidatus Berkiella aquae]
MVLHVSKIGVEVATEFLRDHSAPHQKRFAFSYTITIKNHGKEPAKLLKRHWFITDANGQVQEVKGEGVVGEQPLIQPGRSFRYTSGTILKTPVGSMHGTYQMVCPNGTYYDAIIPPFRLAVPELVN